MRYNKRTIAAILKMLFMTIGWSIVEEGRGWVIVDNHGDAWRVRMDPWQG